MAHDGKEVEIKIKIDDAVFEKVMQQVRASAVFKKRSEQKDTYFNHPQRNFLGVKHPCEWLSIRERDGKGILNYKHFHPEGAEVFTHCDETETVLSDSSKMELLLHSLGFKKLVTVEKQREVFVVNDEFEIGMDTVKDLGHFIEIEALKDFGGVEKTREQLRKAAEELGIKDFNEDLYGYPFLLMEKKGLIKPRGSR